MTSLDHATTLVMMKGSDTDATLDAIRLSGQDVTIEDEGPYWKLHGRGDIHVDLAEVAEELGAPIPMSRWLVSMSSFVGYVDTGEAHFTVRASRSDAIDRDG
ncbi:MAG: MmoB/DmpM family protein [Sporichthyaceae bacterium]